MAGRGQREKVRERARGRKRKERGGREVGETQEKGRQLRPVCL